MRPGGRWLSCPHSPPARRPQHASADARARPSAADGGTAANAHARAQRPRRGARRGTRPRTRPSTAPAPAQLARPRHGPARLPTLSGADQSGPADIRPPTLALSGPARLTAAGLALADGGTAADTRARRPRHAAARARCPAARARCPSRHSSAARRGPAAGDAATQAQRGGSAQPGPAHTSRLRPMQPSGRTAARTQRGAAAGR
jgi:hypothetical protein